MIEDLWDDYLKRARGDTSPLLLSKDELLFVAGITSCILLITDHVKNNTLSTDVLRNLYNEAVDYWKKKDAASVKYVFKIFPN